MHAARIRHYIGATLGVSYYMEEGCGIFAVALSRVFPGGQIGILSRRNGEAWSAAIPYEVTHVFYSWRNHTIDARGPRPLARMAADFDMPVYDVKGPWEPALFAAKFVGSADTKHLFGGAREIKEAIRIIKSASALYNPGKEASL